MEKVTCNSGLRGWRTRLRNNYDNDYDQFLVYDRTYNIHNRLGYDTPEEAWRDNPVIQGSVRPEDLRKVDQAAS